MARCSQSVSCVDEDGVELRETGTDLSDCGGPVASWRSSYNNSKSRNMAAPSQNRTKDRTEVVVKHARTKIDASLAEWETKSSLHQQKRKQGR